jgi:two-component system, LytTR family, response regulator
MNSQFSLLCKPVRSICLPTRNDPYVIDIGEIIRIQSLSNYSKLFLCNGRTVVVAKVLRWFEEQLPPDTFLRIHRTHLVNAEYLRHYQLSEKGRKLELVNGEKIDVSKRKKAGVMELLKSKQMASHLTIIRGSIQMLERAVI